MNKDVIYIEPEDDITDIITKIENSKEKIVALVPPKKAGAFRSIVNIKLIAKSASTNEKTAVLVTTDPSIIRLAATVKLPITKNLQSAPVIPTLDEIAEEASTTEVVDVTADTAGEDSTADTDDEDSTASDEGYNKKRKQDTATKRGRAEAGAEQNSDTEEIIDEDADGDTEAEDEMTADEDAPRKRMSIKPQRKEKPKSGNWFKNHKKLAICGGIGLIALILALVWAFMIAPAVDITVWIQTENKRFSENANFSTTLNAENASEGTFYLEEKKLETTQEVKFEATGQKNLGEKASGILAVSAAFDAKNGGALVIKPGDLFSYNGLSYAADNTVTLAYDGEDDSVCANRESSHVDFKEAGCLIYANVKITATESGTKYNVGPSNNGWSTILNLKGISLNEAITGGTDDITTTVQQSDILKARESLTSGNEAENKKRLYESIGDDFLIIEASFNQSMSDAVSTPAVGEKVENGATPTLKATTTSSVYVIDKTKVKEFITAKAATPDDQKVYEMDDPFIENFTKTGNGYIGKIKTSYAVGPKVTDKEVLEMVLGKGIGDIQHDLKEITGVVTVETRTSYPWVVAVPNDSNKVTVEVKLKEQAQSAQDSTAEAESEE